MSKMIRFELNSRMRKLFERLGIDYKVNPEVEIPEKFYKYIRGGVIKRTNKFAKGCWAYKYNNKDFALDYIEEDCIGNEVANSKIFISAEEENLSILQTTKIALSYIFALSELLKNRRVDFDIILSYQSSMSGDELPMHAFEISFYQKREKLSYLIKNIEAYNKYNGILILSVHTPSKNNINPETHTHECVGIEEKKGAKFDRYMQIRKLLYKFKNFGVYNNKEEGTIFIGSVPSIATYAWLNILYSPVKVKEIEEMEKRLKRTIPSIYKEYLTQFSNGLNILCDTLCLYGIRNSVNSSDGRKPYDIEIPNLFEKPKNSTDKMFFIGWYDWDNSQLYIDENNRICYCSKDDAMPLKKWNSIESMLIDEITRLYTLVDDNGIFFDYSIKTIPI